MSINNELSINLDRKKKMLYNNYGTFVKYLQEIMKRHKTYNFIEVTKQEFQQYQTEPITDAQAYNIQNNLFGVLDLLIQWQRNLISDSEVLKGYKR